MSLSDKHEGKILVPWFCSQEWKHVYYSIYSENSNLKTRKEALEILKIWKMRQVLLSSGVEGTLIVLGAMLMDTQHLDEEKVCLLYATSVMRFLNLCAANNKKQGTFYETARKNNLPDWLIDVRHDLAHDQKVPSRFMLEHCLNYCLDWLKNEYWDAQFSIVRDFVALKKIHRKRNVNKYVGLYGEVVEEVMKRRVTVLGEMKDSVIEKLNSVFKSSNLNSKSETYQVLYVLSKMIMSSFNEARSEEFAEQVSCEIIQSGYIFEIPHYDEFNNTGEKQIPHELLTLWSPILQRLFKNNILYTFLQHLFNVTSNDREDSRVRNSAGVWLNTIFTALLEAKQSNGNTTSSAVLKFNVKQAHNLWQELKKFQDVVIQDPNVVTSLFVRKLLAVNGCPQDYTTQLTLLIKSYTVADMSETDADYQLHTVQELTDSFQDVHFEEQEQNETFDVDPLASLSCSKKWQRVDDTSTFAGCPLGVLPHQKRTSNALLF